MVVLDTSILIDFMDGKIEARKAIEKFEGHGIRITVFTKYELLRGETPANAAKIHGVLKTLNILYYTDEAVEESVTIYKSLKARGRLINEIDVLIAAISIRNGDILLTSDKHFNDIASPYITVV